MKHLLKLLLIAVIAMPFGMQISAQEVSSASNCKILRTKHVAKPYQVVPNRNEIPRGLARVTLVAGDLWGDGSGYQMLLDADANAYGTIIPETSGLTESGNASAATYAEFEYKIPENADGALTTANIVINGQASILIPAGTYDWCITNPTPGDRVWIASSNGNVGGRADDYVFESGKSYVFTVSISGSNDAVNVEIADVSSYSATITGNGSIGEVLVGETGAATFMVMNTGLEAFTPVLVSNNDAFTVTSAVSGPLASGESRNYFVTFLPTATESYSGTLTLSAEESIDVSATMDLSGIGVTEKKSTLADGNDQSQMYPVYGNYFDEGATSQMIYPAEMLEQQGIVDGVVINSLKFFVNSCSRPQDLTHSLVTMTLGETQATTVTSARAMADNRNNSQYHQEVFSEYISISNNELTINFATPYIYHGGNLIIDNVVEDGGSGSSYYEQCYWVGDNNNTDASYCVYGSSNSISQGSFLPKIEISMQASLEPTESLDFGTVRVGNGRAKTAKIMNQSNEAVQATVTVSPNPTFSVSSTTITLAANSLSYIPVTFFPTDAVDYNGTLTITFGDETVNIPLSGIGTKDGPEAIRDEAFFEGIEYTWKDSENVSHTNNLAEIATDPDQIIAMLKEVYTNRSIPGTYKRGFKTDGSNDHDNLVTYAGVGKIKRDSNGNVVWSDDYGWGIEGNIISEGQIGSRYYWHMDPDQYKPYYEGMTMLLLEIVDDFVPVSTGKVPEHNYSQLREYIRQSIKSARIITEAKRVDGKEGQDFSSGTMFKIDCDKMNKFFLISKGQLAWWSPTQTSSNYTGYNYPCYVSSSSSGNNGTYADYGLASGYLDSEPALFCHMFEQFSPSEGNSSSPLSDGYKLFVTEMKSFGIDHDCPNVPFCLGSGHHFMMYGQDSGADDCQDIRDMMFFVPDYRMMDWTGRGNSTTTSSRTQDYFTYNTSYQPSIGVFVIKQNEIPSGTIISQNLNDWTGLYKHQLSWESNLDKYLPGEEQQYELWEIVVDEFGVESYQQVYYRNPDGSYVLENGEKKPIVLDRVNMSSFTYTDVYVDMTKGSQTKTYVIRGRDKGGFLSLQMSNPEEIVIPGLDPNEKAYMVGATYYSRYNAKDQKNCYSNKIELTNSGMTLTAADMANGMTFYRSSRSIKINDEGIIETDGEGNIVYENNEEVIATGTASNGVLTITLDKQSPASEYPNGKTSGTSVGYHANPVNSNGKLTFAYTINNAGFVRFTNDNFAFWDNFTVEVDNNTHPLQYLYRMEIGDAYSNNVRVPVYKTDSRINGSFTKDDVDNDGYQLVDGNLVSANIPSVEVSEDVEFESQVQLSSKQDILRYDAYRWSDTEIANLAEAHSQGITIINVVENGTEDDVDPTGQAGNQGDFYTVTMNKKSEPQYYYAAPEEDQPTVDTENPTNWANFIDSYPRMQTSANEYLYAPVVELFTRGYKEQLDNQGNKVKRDDYNSYGGPQQTTAIGQFKFIDEDKIQFSVSDYSWPGARNLPQYCYYNVFLNFNSAAIPAGYKLYMVRAWRQAPADMLGEQTPNENDATADYGYRTGTSIGAGEIDGVTYENMNSFMFDEIKYDNNEYCVISTTNEIDQGAKDITQYKFGDQPVSTTIINGVEVPNVWNYTFGARRVSGLAGEEGWNTVDEVPLKFIVRAYFTKEDNINGSKADADGKFYITEKTIEYKITGNGNIVTAVSDVKINKQVVGVTYYNTTGLSSNEPFDGINIVVTRYSDGTTTSTKVLK